MPAPRIARPVARGKPKPNLRRRMQHLAFIRQLPCVACGKAAPSDAAHVRTGTDGGAGRKPGDRYAVPLCTTCHANQHRVGPHSASILSMWLCGCGLCRPMSRRGSALSFGRDNRSIWLQTLDNFLEDEQRNITCTRAKNGFGGK